MTLSSQPTIRPVPPHVVVDLSYFTGRVDGIESYARGLLPALAAHDDLRFVGAAGVRDVLDPHENRL